MRKCYKAFVISSFITILYTGLKVILQHRWKVDRKTFFSLKILDQTLYCIIEKYVTNANRTDIFLIPKPGPRARRGIRDSHRMSFYDARFHHTFQCLSLNVKDQYWERDLAEHEVWLPNWRRHQAKAGAVRALGRGSRLRIPRRRASPMLKSSWASASTRGWLVDIFLCLTEMRLRFAKMYPYVPLRGCNKYKKKIK